MPLLRHTEYVNASLAGVTTAGVRFAVATGKHEPGFPYDTPESEWDHLLFVLGERCGAASAGDLRNLAIRLDPEQNDGPASITFGGIAGGADLLLDLHFEVRTGPRHALGKPFGLLGRRVPGMAWRPFALLGESARSTLAVDGETHPIAALFGEIEHAYVTAFHGTRMAFVYDYVCVATADTQAPYAFVDFTSHALRRKGLFGWLYDAYLRWTGRRSLTLDPGGIHPGNERKVLLTAHTEASVVRVSDDVSLGYATLKRQLVALEDASGRPLLGLREIFVPSPDLPP